MKLWNRLLMVLLCLIVMASVSPSFARNGRLQKFFSRFQVFNRQAVTQPAATAVPTPAEVAPAAPAPTDIAPIAPDATWKQPQTPLKVEDITLSPGEESLLDGLNKYRVDHGVQPLSIDPDLQKTARERAIRMARERAISPAPDLRGDGHEMNFNKKATVKEPMSALWKNRDYVGLLLQPHQRIGLSAYTAQDGTGYYAVEFSED